MASQQTGRHRKRSDGRTLGIFAVALGTIIWGTVGPVVKLFPEGTEFQYSLIRNLSGTTALWLFVLLSKNKKRYTKEDIVPILVAGTGAVPAGGLGHRQHRTGCRGAVDLGHPQCRFGLFR